jgi:hypothetical protein
VVSSARTDEVLKVIVANPTMIEAHKAGTCRSGRCTSVLAARPDIPQLGRDVAILTHNGHRQGTPEL